MAQTAQDKNVGDWLLQRMRNAGLVTTLGLAYMDWAQQRAQEPVYPSNPITDCPRMDLYIDETQPKPWPAGQSQILLAYTFWYKKRHAPAVPPAAPVNHQLAIVQDVQTIENVFLGKWQPEEMKGHAGVKVYHVYFGTIRYHDDLRHEFDEPRLRLSVAEIPLAIETRVL